LQGTATFEVDLVGSGATGAVPQWATTFLPACAWLNSAGTFTRSLVVANQQTVTIAQYRDGMRQVLGGATGTFQIVTQAGQDSVISRVKFTFTGKYWEETDAALLTPTYPTIIPPRGYESFHLGSAPYSANPATITLTAGNTVKLLEGANDANKTGYRYGIVSDFASTVEFDPDATNIATRDYHDLFLTSAEESGSYVIGADAHNTITLGWTKGQIKSHPFGNRDKWVTRNIMLALNTGFTIAFT
jgi:hypothetical protein